MNPWLDRLNVTPIMGGQNWCINSVFRYASAADGLVIVPELFVTDFASVPRPLRVLYPVWDTYGPAAIIHDWLYQNQATTRATADLLLREAMESLAVEEHIITDIYTAVHLAGQSSWDQNAALKKSGYRRLASAESNPPFAQIAA